MSITLPRLCAVLPALVLLAASPVILSQGLQNATPPPAPAASLTEQAVSGLRPVLTEVGDAVSDLGISHWKASSGLRNSTEGDVASIQRDLNGTLPTLLDQALASGSAVAPAFAVYRNVDALYDVLLRISALANLAGSSTDAGRLESARAALEAGRNQLGNALLQSATAQDTQLIQLRAQRVVPKAPPPPPTKIVVDDGPETTTHHRKKPASSATPKQ